MRPRTALPAGPLLLLAALAALAFAARPLTPIDETRYVGVAWEMWLRGDWLVLFKNGTPYSHKPPLLFWLYNLGWALTGVNEWWPRLVSPLFSLGCLLLTLSLARRLWPGRAGVATAATWILASSLLWMLFSTAAMFDVMLAFFVLLGLRGLLLAADGATLRGFAWLAIAIGFGVLAKGPVILLHLLPAALLAPWWRPGLGFRRWYGGLLLAVLGGAAIALAWALPAAAKGGEEYARMIFWGQTAGRVADSFAHKRAIWWYLPLLPLLLFPWLAWPALWRRAAGLRREGLDGGLRFCLAWLLPAFATFSLISGKQVHYLVPLVPGFALLAARLLARSADGGSALLDGLWLPALLAAAAGAAMLALSPGGPGGKLELWQDLPRWPGAALLLASALAVMAGRKAAWRLIALALLGAALFALVQLWVSDALWLRYDVGPVAEEVGRLQARGTALANKGEYHAQYQFAGRLRQPLDEVDSPEEIAAWFARHPGGVLIAYEKPQPGEPPPLFSRPWIGETVMLLDAAGARARGLLR